jgi:5-methyltetrahydrofolate corrinoid/iron sulfur protein methyltransferase
MANLCVAENINVMSNTIGPAMRNKDPKPIQEMAVKLTENGADVLDINLGPARKGGPEMMQFVVKTVQEVSSLPLFLDTMNVEAMEAGLQVYEVKDAKAIINSIMARPERMASLLPLVGKYECEFVALLYGPDGLPRDENERGELAAVLQAESLGAGYVEDIMWFDPIVVPVNSQQQQVPTCTAFMEMLPMMFPTCKSTCGLSNISNGSPEHLRPILNQVYLCMLRKHGLHSAILDGLDMPIINISKDRNPEFEKLVHDTMDGNAADLSGLSKEEKDIVKTTKLLMAETLYSDSWLDL